MLLHDQKTMTLDESISSLNYLFNKLIESEQLVSLDLYGSAYIPKCKVKSVRSLTNGYTYEVLADNGTQFTLNPEKIRYIRFDVISDVVTSFEMFKSSLASAEVQTGNFDFMVHFMVHDENRDNGFLLTVKVLKSS
ncbi:hypothetical protein WJ0W_007151 [Paenibacillus melissococcoides]|uniref:Uncharacterized protein n=1 Tax=Paenibacillus melissococcoides TaxID=2912268 RepID=A0ABN8UBI9_9BACL|nr:hypothetical protein [Paenibacillus melissococcoides]CAH8248484.1 hypothetical protein WJ0W_007151 [Paenibacillus melissococcoides]CAH8722088.1 hypothetical protein HTL2_006689 [Paenibacillus melissococcoides]CAH8722117.1 hypothetical protein WDD9_006628 [Paenibacillus melissococcoides]